MGTLLRCLQHYIPTLFAVKGLEDEMACSTWGVAAMDWSRGGAHPRSYRHEDVQPQLIRYIRDVKEQPAAAAAQMTAVKQFISADAILAGGRGCAEVGPLAAGAGRFAAMPHTPKLTARKFPMATVDAVLRLFRDCSNGLYLLGHRACESGREGEKADPPR